MIRTLVKVIIIVVLIVVVIGKLPDRHVTHCTATVTGDDGTAQTVPC